MKRTILKIWIKYAKKRNKADEKPLTSFYGKPTYTTKIPRTMYPW